MRSAGYGQNNIGRPQPSQASNLGQGSGVSSNPAAFLGIFQTLLKSSQPIAETDNVRNPIITKSLNDAAYERDAEMVRAICANDVEASNRLAEDGWLPIHKITRKFEQKAESNQAKQKQELKDIYDTANALLKAKADINAKAGDNQESALHHAGYNKDFMAALALVALGADITILDAWEKDAAAKTGYVKGQEEDASPEMIVAKLTHSILCMTQEQAMEQYLALSGETEDSSAATVQS